MSKKKKKSPVMDHGITEYRAETVKPVIRSLPRIVQIGDTVQRRPRTLGTDKELPGLLSGEVVYIHPFGRFHTVLFRFSNGAAVRESFHGIER